MTALLKLINKSGSLFPGIKQKFAGYWYRRALVNIPPEDFAFMNYGFSDPELEKSLHLEAPDEKHRYCTQLYHQLVSSVELAGKDVLEIGCGFGGGASYIMRYLKPRSMTAVDANERSIAEAQRMHSVPGLSFRVGESERLPFENGKFDVVINVESSHCYASMRAFLNEVRRVLRGEGLLLWCDFRNKDKIEDTKREITSTPFSFVKEEDITARVVESLDKIAVVRGRIIDESASGLSRFFLKEFAGLPGTAIYNTFRNRDYIYLSCVLRKDLE